MRLQRGGSARRARVAALAAAAGIRVHEVDGAEVRRLAGTEHHQGVAARADPYQYRDLESVLAGVRPPLLVLDQVQDPHNLGALIRTAAAVGAAAVILPRHGAAGVSPVVEHVAAGAAHDVSVCRVANLHRCLLALRSAGYWNVALSPRGAASLYDVDLPDPVALVLGGEAGLRPLVERSCDRTVAIPVRPGVESLNASVAGAVAMYEIARRQGRLAGRATTA